MNTLAEYGDDSDAEEGVPSSGSSSIHEKAPIGMDMVILDKVREHLALKKSTGFDIVASIRSKKEFENPYILQEVIEYFEIDEHASNYPEHIFNPRTCALDMKDEIDGDREIADIVPEKSTVSDQLRRSLSCESLGEEKSVSETGRKRKSRWDSTETTTG